MTLVQVGKTYFRHFNFQGLDVPPYKGGVTLAYRVESDDGYLMIVGGIAFCNPADQFCKATGRELAEANLNGEFCFIFSLPGSLKELGKPGDLGDKLFGMVKAFNSNTPQWFKNRYPYMGADLY